MKTLISEDRQSTIIKCLSETKALKGDTAELGVYEGVISRLMAEQNGGTLHHAYDTFEGMPEDDIIKGGHSKGDFQVDYPTVKALLNLPNIRIHKGLFPSTAFDTKYKLVHLDADIYQSTKAGLEFFIPRMVPGGFIVLDDLDWPACPGVRRCVDEMGLKPERWANIQGVLRF